FDEWVRVAITLDFEHGSAWGSYGEDEQPPLPLDPKWRELEDWWVLVRSQRIGDPPDPEPDTEVAWIDNFTIEVIPPCPADCDQDYAHSFFDFLCFQNMFAAGSSRADCDLDGELTVFDFLCFQNYFAQGCD